MFSFAEKLALALLLFAAEHAPAQATQLNELSGVWKGRLGTQSITACFNDEDRSGVAAAYYYDRHLTPIALDPLNLRRWAELPAQPAPNWQLQAPDGDRVVGQWRAADGGRYLDIALQRVPSTSPACSSDAFNAPVEAHYRMETGKPKRFGEYSYRPLSYIGEASLELLGEGEATARINRELRARLPLTAAQKQEVFEQQRERVGTYLSSAFDETSAEPEFWSPDFVTVDFYRWTAGTGRDGIYSQYLSWDLQSGQQVDPWSWFGVKVAEDESPTLPEGVEAFEAPDPERGSCEDYRGRDSWSLLLEAKGVHFWEDAFGEAECERDIFIPYDKLDPLLTKAGKNAVARLRARPGISRN